MYCFSPVKRALMCMLAAAPCLPGLVACNAGGSSPSASGPETAAITQNVGSPLSTAVSAIPPDFVATPNGYFHRSCVLEGQRIGEGLLQRVDGSAEPVTL